MEELGRVRRPGCAGEPSTAAETGWRSVTLPFPSKEETAETGGQLPGVVVPP